MIIIFEGPDGAGKTTLALRTALRLSGTYFHADVDEWLCGAMRSYHESILRFANVNSTYLGRFVCLDRLWPTEWVYSQLLRPKYFASSVAQDWFQYMYGECMRMGVLYVYCFDPKSKQRHLDSDKPDKYTSEEYDQIVELYEDWMKSFPATVYKYELGVTTVSMLEQAIYEAAERLP